MEIVGNEMEIEVNYDIKNVLTIKAQMLVVLHRQNSVALTQNILRDVCEDWFITRQSSN